MVSFFYSPFFCPRDPPQSAYKGRSDGVMDTLDICGLSATPLATTGITSDDEEAVPAHYQNHCEQLMQLQRQQNEQLLLADESGHSAVSVASGSLLNISNNSSSKPATSVALQGALQTRRTIDSGMAETALSVLFKGNTAPSAVPVKQTSVPAFVTTLEAVPGTSQMGTPVQTIRNGPVPGEAINLAAVEELKILNSSVLIYKKY